MDFHQSHDADEEAKAKLKHQTLLNEFLILQKELVSKKRKLQAAKRKRTKILNEVRFLRRRHRHLTTIQVSNKEEDLFHLQNSDKESNALEKERNNSAHEAAFENSSRKGEEDGREHRVLERERVFVKRPKNGLTHGKLVVKRKISWQDQSAPPQV